MNNNIFNSFSLVGNIAKIGDIKEQSNGKKFRFFTLAQNSRYIDKNGETVESVFFIDIKLYEKHFNEFEKMLEVGKYVHVMGKVNVYKDESGKNNIYFVANSYRTLSKEKRNYEEIFEYDWLNDDEHEVNDNGICL